MSDEDVLAGVRVLDASQLLPGPWATLVLADLGAEVTKVEPPGGEGGRLIRGELFAAANRNKRSVIIDLKTADGVRRFLDLAREHDVLVEGFRPGVMDRLGVGYSAVAAVNPGIIYCSISGYGAYGEQLSGHDINYLAASGALGFSGHWGETPRRPGVPMADLGSASYAVIAILGALYQRTRTGTGCHLDVSMTDVMTAWAAARGGPRLDRHADDRRHLYPTNDIFETADGRLLALGAVEERFWEPTRKALASVDPAFEDERFKGLDNRIRYGDELHALLHETFAKRDRDTWLAMFAGTDAPVSPVRSLSEATEDNDVVATLDGERHVVFPVRRNGKVMGALRSTAPALSTVEGG